MRACSEARNSSGGLTANAEFCLMMVMGFFSNMLMVEWVSTILPGSSKMRGEGVLLLGGGA